MIKHFRAALLAAFVLFIWGMISWMVLPWHQTMFNSFKDEAKVSTTILENISKSGMYVLPSINPNTAQKSDIFIFSSISPNNLNTSMAKPFGISFLTQFLAALIVSWMLAHAQGYTYLRRVGFVLAFGLAAGIVTELPYWNWFCFDPRFTAIAIANLVIGWFLAGLVLAKYSVK